MTALNISTDIPSNITTVEQLNVWTNKCLWTLNPTLNAVEGDNYSQRACQSGEYFIASVNKTRHVGRTSIEMDADLQVGSQKDWMYAKELSTTPLTAAMKAN
jgi:hypothetical protein